MKRVPYRAALHKEIGRNVWYTSCLRYLSMFVDYGSSDALLIPQCKLEADQQYISCQLGQLRINRSISLRMSLPSDRQEGSCGEFGSERGSSVRAPASLSATLLANAQHSTMSAAISVICCATGIDDGNETKNMMEHLSSEAHKRP